ncbi:hypothetical protein ANN_20042 [Periplaneta americana]|uniref:MADF domain-containing protein n=1 Tax=Periplaneta americana TaxID=6978 RepID=A0ABQ8SBI8_PERAM|nr:hypothetical protein ANN_20042 [Periplaneta americana]
MSYSGRCTSLKLSHFKHLEISWLEDYAVKLFNLSEHCVSGKEIVVSDNFYRIQEDRDITYALFCSVLCIMEQVLFDEILILSVEENPHVYDKRRASYKDEKMKENTWLSIAASLNTDRGDTILNRSSNRCHLLGKVLNNSPQKRKLRVSCLCRSRVLGENPQTIRENTGILLEASKEIGLEVNPEKTKYMIMSRDENIVRNGNIKIGNLSFEEVEKFKYLGATVTNINDTRQEIRHRINMGNACYYSIEKILLSSLLSKNLKFRIYKTVILPVVLYGCET